MKIYIADSPAFCYGVQRAYDLSKENIQGTVYMFGPLIHNPQIVKEFEEKGVKIIQDIQKLKPKDTVILRAHGVSNGLRKKLEKQKVRIVDGTCPFVTKAHLLAENFINQGLKLVIIGDQNHPEIKGIYEDFPTAIVIKDFQAIQNQNFLPTDQLGIICQTTIQLLEVEKIVEALKQKTTKVFFENTICNATHEKQASAKKLAQNMDLMLVVGGKNSNNTQMLYEICQKICPTYLISDLEEIQKAWFKGKEKIGITGGASTPLWLIEKIKLFLENF